MSSHSSTVTNSSQAWGRVVSTWHLLQLYLCGSESALSSELSSFSSEEIPILPMNSSRWWSSISAMSCRKVTHPSSNTVSWYAGHYFQEISCLLSKLYLCPLEWAWAWPLCGSQSHLSCPGTVLEDGRHRLLQHCSGLGATLYWAFDSDRLFSHLSSNPVLDILGLLHCSSFP